MKRFMFIVVLSGVSILAIWAFSAVFATAPRDIESDNTPIKVKVEIDKPLKTKHSVDLPAPTAGVDMKIAPVFDSTGAIVSDPTGTILNANKSDVLVLPVTGMDVKIAPVFDSTGAIVSDPTGTILSISNP